MSRVIKTQPPFCCACGVHIPSDEAAYSFPAVDNDDHEKRLAREGDMISRHNWANKYRVLIKCIEPRDDGQQYRLSGISRFGYLLYFDIQALLFYRTESQRFIVPWDPNKMVTQPGDLGEAYGDHQDKRAIVYPANLWDDRNQDQTPYGYPVHAYCWGMMERIIGPVVKDNLELLIETLHERWKDHDFEVKSCLSVGRYWKDMEVQRSEESEDEDGFAAMLVPEARVATADPRNVPQIMKVIERARKIAASEVSTGRSIGSQQDLGLPLEIQYMIIDCLRPQDCRNFLKAMGWRMRLSYWRSRFSRLRWYFPEADALKLEQLDQEYLYQELEELLWNKRLFGMQNRKRIVRILERTRDLFLSKLGQRELSN